jgi:hypothetical protein
MPTACEPEIMLVDPSELELKPDTCEVDAAPTVELRELEPAPLPCELEPAPIVELKLPI